MELNLRWIPVHVSPMAILLHLSPSLNLQKTGGGGHQLTQNGSSPHHQYLSSEDRTMMPALITGTRRSVTPRSCFIISSGWPSWLGVASALGLVCTAIFIDHHASDWCQQLILSYPEICWHPFDIDGMDAQLSPDNIQGPSELLSCIPSGLHQNYHVLYSAHFGCPIALSRTVANVIDCASMLMISPHPPKNLVLKANQNESGCGRMCSCYPHPNPTCYSIKLNFTMSKERPLRFQLDWINLKLRTLKVNDHMRDTLKTF